QQIPIVKAANNCRSKGSEGVDALCPPPLQVFLRTALPVTLGYIIASGNAKNRSPGLLPIDIFRLLSDHNHQLAFVMRILRVIGDDDLLFRMLCAGNRLIKQLRIRRRCSISNVAPIVEADSENLRGLTWAK